MRPFPGTLLTPPRCDVVLNIGVHEISHLYAFGVMTKRYTKGIVHRDL